MESLLNEARAIGAGRKATAEHARDAIRIVLNILRKVEKLWEVSHFATLVKCPPQHISCRSSAFRDMFRQNEGSFFTYRASSKMTNIVPLDGGFQMFRIITSRTFSNARQYTKVLHYYLTVIRAPNAPLRLMV